MPRRKKLDVNPVVEAFLAEVEFRVSRSLKEAVRDIERRLDRLEKRVAGKAGRAAPTGTSKTCRRTGCNGRVIAHRLCSRHYQQWRYHRKKAEQKGAAKAAPSRRKPSKATQTTAAKAATSKKPARKRSARTSTP